MKKIKYKLMCRLSPMCPRECDQNKHLTFLCISNSFNFNVQSHNNINNMCYVVPRLMSYVCAFL